MASTLNNLGILASYRGDPGTTLRRYEEALAIRRDIGDRLGIGVSLNNLGIVYKDAGDFDRATQYYEESLLIHQENDDKHSMSFPLNNLGAIAFERGAYEEARALFQRSLALREESGDRWSIASVVSSLGDVALAVGDYEEAQRCYRQSLELFRDIGDRLKIANNVIGLARVMVELEAADSGAMQTAAALCVWIERMLAAERLALELSHQKLLASTQAIIERCLDEAAFAKAEETGRHISLEQAIALVLESAPLPRSAH
jgi:tetratricopeptide (TPR) repeat protein